MNEPRKQMDKALREIVVPSLRARGFKGRFPNLKRTKVGQIDLIDFQYFTSGTSLCVNISAANEERLVHLAELGISADKVTPSCIPDASRRLRHKNQEGEITDSFVFVSSVWLQSQQEPTVSFYQSIAKQILASIDSQAEQWWTDPNLLISANWLHNSFTDVPGSEIE